MPLSKEKKVEYQREYRRRQKLGITQAQIAQPPVIPNWVLHPNAYLSGHLRYCPDYDPVQPGDHFEHCPFVDPMLRVCAT